MAMRLTKLVSAADLTATGVFAVEGAAIGARNGLDLFGVLVVGFATALVGGIVRDVLLGDTPPAALKGWAYAVTAFAGGGVLIVFDRWIADVPSWLLTGLDAAGLGLFAVTGAAKALAHHLNALSATLLGIITAVGGGVVRDVLLNRVPTVLSGHIYAVAALAGALIVTVGSKTRVPTSVCMGAGVVICFAIRILSVIGHWNLPRVTS